MPCERRKGSGAALQGGGDGSKLPELKEHLDNGNISIIVTPLNGMQVDPELLTNGDASSTRSPTQSDSSRRRNDARTNSNVLESSEDAASNENKTVNGSDSPLLTNGSCKPS